MDTNTPERVVTRKFRDHRIVALLAAAVIVSIVFCGVGVFLYHFTGADQVDLSRPDYQEASELVQGGADQYTEYSASGEITKESLQQFDKLFQDRLSDINKSGAFGGDPISPGALGVNSGTD